MLVRGQRVMLDADLATLYRVPTKALVQAVRRNALRFPGDFMFRLTDGEAEGLRSQIVTSNASRGRGGRRYAPYAFTEQGVAMLSSVLRSRRAIEANIAIMRAFVKGSSLSAPTELLMPQSAYSGLARSSTSRVSGRDSSPARRSRSLVLARRPEMMAQPAR